MRVLVTGIDGYIGAVLGPKLLERGFDVVGIDCGFYRDGWFYNDQRPRPLTFTKDVRQITARDVEGFEAVVHLAELSNDPLGELSECITYEINHLGSIALARARKENGDTYSTTDNMKSVEPLWVDVSNTSVGIETTPPVGANFALDPTSKAIGYGLTEPYLPPTSVDAGACPSGLARCP
jgi:nucleoside-diphosphate-sugar epimerase